MTKILNYKYSPYILAIVIFFWYLPNITPGYTWVSAGVDHFDFIFAARFHLVPHSTGFPAYMIPANLVLMASPNTHIAWTMAITLSMIPMVITGVLVHLSVKKLIENWGSSLNKEFETTPIDKTFQLIDYKIWTPYVAQLITYGAVLLIAQTFIVEVYLFSIMIAMTAITFHIYGKHNWASVFIGLAFASHGLTWTMMGLLLLINWKTYISKWWILSIFAITPYAYLPIAMSMTEFGEENTLRNNQISEYYRFFKFGSSSFWWGTLPIWKVPERIWDSLILISVTLGLGSLSLILFIKHDMKKYWWLILIIAPTLYYWFGTAVNIVHVHFALAVPVIIILASLGLKYSTIHPKYYALVALAIILTIPFYWDLGRTLDKNQASQSYYDFFDTLENDDHVIINVAITTVEKENETVTALTDGVAIWWGTLLYNRLNNRKITPISPNKYLDVNNSFDPARNEGRKQTSLNYQNSLIQYGLNPVDALLLKEQEGTGWYVELNGKEINIPDNIYDPCDPSCIDPERNIFQIQQWWLIDRIFLANPNQTIHLTENIGREEKDIIDRIYTRDLLPTNIAIAFEQIYNEAGISITTRGNTRNNFYNIDS